MLSILIASSSPNSSAIWIALPGSLVCTCTLTTSRSPITSTQLPMRSRRLRRRATSESFTSGLGWETMNSVQ